MSRLSPTAPWSAAVGLLSAVIVASLLSACGSTAGGQRGTGTGTPVSSGDQGRAQRAAQLLDRFTAARGGGDPAQLHLGDLLEQQEGDWEPAVGENNKLAWLTGHLVAAAPLPDAPGPGKVLHGSGSGVSTTVVSADDALAAMTARRSSCAGCTDLRVTGATLTTMDVQSSAGFVRVPAWRFTLEGTAVSLLRVAVPLTGLIRAAPCPAIGAERTVDVVLEAPLGDRTVLNLAGGGVVVRG